MALTDGEALEALYDATGGAGWRKRGNWCTSRDLSRWYGIQTLQERWLDVPAALSAARGCSDDARELVQKVIGLTLARNELIGPIPPELGGLTALSRLNLSANRLHGLIPPELGSLTALLVLNLAENQLQGHIPKQLENLRNLEWLHLQRNRLSGNIPRELGSLSNLLFLGLQANGLAGTIPVELGNLTTLNELELAGNGLTGSVPAQFVKLQQLEQLSLGGNQLSGPVPSARQLRELHQALVSPSFMSKDAEGVRSGMPTTAGGMSEHAKEEPPNLGMVKQLEPRGGTETRASDNYAIDDGDKMAIISDFEGSVVAWYFGTRTEVLRSDDAEVELEVPDLGRTIPALIGVCSSSAEVVGGKQCLLHPIVTCLAQADEKFDPPLRLRFPVGDIEAMESGSDSGTPDEAESAYRAHLESTFSAWTREDSHSAWVPIDGTIKEVEGGVFVLEVAVSHFCDFALKQDIHVDDGSVEVVELAKLKRKSRRAHYHFVNLGTENLVVYCWGAPRTRGFLDTLRLKMGFGSYSGSAEVEAKRTLVDVPGTGVYKVDVPSRPPLGGRRKVACLVAADGPESLTVAYTTQETVRPLMGSAHELVQVWGRRSMQQKHAMLFGALTGSSRMVSDLKVDNGVNVGELVKTLVG